MRSLHFVLRRSVVLFALTPGLLAQLVWTSSTGAPPNLGFLAFDSIRDRIVALGASATYEFDGQSWQGISSLHLPSPGGVMAYDGARGRCIMVTIPTMDTWEWDGLDWTHYGQAPAFGTKLVYDTAIGRVLLLTEDVSGGSNSLFEWTGTGWSFLDYGPGLQGSVSTYYVYGPLAYDQRSDRLVMFGRREAILSSGSVINDSPITLEYGRASGWTIYGPSGTFAIGEAWFDMQRGAVMRLDGPLTTPTLSQYLGVGQWTGIPIVGQGLTNAALAAYDGKRNRLYMPTNTDVGYVSDVHPALFEFHASGCSSSLAPTLQLAAPWTRAWINRSLAVQVRSVTSALAILAMGFSDQAYGSALLPLDLAPYGMPGCNLNVAPQATAIAALTANIVDYPIGVPNLPALVGVQFWQQAFSPAPGANAAGILASDSMRGVVGRSQ